MVMESEGQFLMGALANISATGALLTNPTGDLEVGAKGRIKLTNLSQALRTTSAPSIRMEAEIVRKEIGGFGISFLGNLDELQGLLERAFGRQAIDYS